MRILLAEDDEDDVQLFKDALTSLGTPVELEVAGDGQALMDILYACENPPDGVFMDINMPLKNGLECLMEIRHDLRLKAVPIIIMSTTMQKKTMEITYELGANFFLTKPTSFLKLSNFLEQALEWLRDPKQTFFFRVV